MLTAVYHFKVPGLWVKQELLGTSKATTFSGHDITLILPRDETDFGIGVKDAHQFPTISAYAQDKHGRRLATEVLMIRVEVKIEGDLSPPPSMSGLQATGYKFTEAMRILRETVGLAREFAQRYIALTRTQPGQFWLESSESQLRVTWSTELRDHDGSRVPVGYSDPPYSAAISMYTLELAISRELHDRLVRKTSEREEPGLAEIFLADAKHVAFNTDHANLRHAVLLSAIACEIKVKQAVTTLASPEQRPIIDLLLENPRDWSMGAASLFNKGIEAVCHRSLRKENKELYKEIDLLFQDRNKIAHRGNTGISNDEILKKHIRSASLVFEWLNHVISQVGERK